MVKIADTSLGEARKLGRMDQFCADHPSKGDKGRFMRLLDAMARGEPRTPGSSGETSPTGASEGCSETQTRQGTSKDA